MDRPGKRGERRQTAGSVESHASKGNRYSDEVKAEALRRYQTPEPLEQITRDLGCSAVTLRSWARKADLPRKERSRTTYHRVFPESVVAEAVARYSADERTELIAADVGASADAIQQWGRREGIYRRGRQASVLPHTKPAEVRAEALRRYQTREPLDEIAADVGVSVAMIRRWARQENLPRKPRAVPREDQTQTTQ